MDFTEILEKDLKAAKERMEKLVATYNQVVMAIQAQNGELAYLQRKLAERKQPPVPLRLADPTPAPEDEAKLEQLARIAKGDLRPGDPGYAEARKREEEALGKFDKEVYKETHGQ